MAVLSAQRTCISLCRASSNLSLDKLHEIAESAMKDQLSQLGFDVTGNVRCFLHPLLIKLSLKLYKLIGLLITGARNPFSASPEPLHWSRRARYGRVFPQDTTSGGAMRDCGAVCFSLNPLTKTNKLASSSDARKRNAIWLTSSPTTQRPLRSRPTLLSSAFSRLEC